jgi:ABC-2 type transport system ATP-binding protein
LLDDPNVIDAVPEGGFVRLVGKQSDGDARGLRDDALANVTVRATQPRFEDGFMVLLRHAVGEQPVGGAMQLDRPVQVHVGAGEAMVAVRDLVRRFGAFVAVDHVSFEVHRGEVFGLLGPNGAGKTTTFRMLCGLLAATAGTLTVAGVDVRRAPASARQRIGYVAQKFSLYAQLSVVENLQFFAGAYGLRGTAKRDRVAWALRQFELEALARLPSGQLPGGFKQRLAMAAALLHEPEIVFLDEPTSGTDPLARREFWRRITALAEQGVTAIVTTHFMEEAEYCDRVAVMDAGRILAQGTPAEILRRAPAEPGRTVTIEDAFIAIVEEARHAEALHGPSARPANTEVAA